MTIRQYTYVGVLTTLETQMMLSKGGIYRIIDRDNGDSYVGQAKCFTNRFSQHKKRFPDSHYLYEVVFVIFEYEKFYFDVLEQCFLDYYKPELNGIGQGYSGNPISRYIQANWDGTISVSRQNFDREYITMRPFFHIFDYSDITSNLYSEKFVCRQSLYSHSNRIRNEVSDKYRDCIGNSDRCLYDHFDVHDELDITEHYLTVFTVNYKVITNIYKQMEERLTFSSRLERLSTIRFTQGKEKILLLKAQLMKQIYKDNNLKSFVKGDKVKANRIFLSMMY